MIRHIRFAELRPEPWRNGGGSTVEIARSGGAADFDWRISIATIAASGPFSAIAGVDRCLLVLDGHVTLVCAEAAPRQLDVRTEPFHFDGGAATDATLPDGPATVLNIMTPRNAQPVAIWRDGDMASGESGTCCFLNTAATWTMAAYGHAPIVIEPFDALLWDGTAPASFAFATPARGIWVRLSNS